jgi:hypothetical protein
MAKKSIWKVESMTAKLLPLIAALLLLGVALAHLGYTQMSSSMAGIISIIAIVGILLLEAKGVPSFIKGKDAKKAFQWGVFAVALLVIIAVVPPMMGIVVPVIGEYIGLITLIGALLALSLMFA